MVSTITNIQSLLISNVCFFHFKALVLNLSYYICSYVSFAPKGFESIKTLKPVCQIDTLFLNKIERFPMITNACLL